MSIPTWLSLPGVDSPSLICVMQNFVKNITFSVSHSFRSQSMPGFPNLSPASSQVVEIHLQLMNYLCVLLGTIVLWFIYRVLFLPSHTVKDLNDIGYGHLKLLNPKRCSSMIKQVQKRRKVGDLPPAFPNGWYSLIESWKLNKSQVVQIDALGENFAVFRDEDGMSHVLDAYCPHMGANMAVGGVIKGGCIECPFHGWKFEGKSGKCVAIPYVQKIPEIAKIRRWESSECNGLIFVWYDAEKRKPLYKVPVVEEIKNGKWYCVASIEHQILCHIQEILENGADTAHLTHLHGPSSLKGSDLCNVFSNKNLNKLFDYSYHEWEINEWKVDDEEPHKTNISVTHELHLLGGLIRFLKTTAHIQQIGPGFVIMQFELFGGRAVILQVTTPLGPHHQLAKHYIYCNTWMAPLAKFILKAEILQYERDVMIWNSKYFLGSPMLMSEEKRIKKYRRWFSQFYSENSKKINFFKKDDINW